MEEQGLPGESVVEEDRVEGVSAMSLDLAEGQERLRDMDMWFCNNSMRVQREFQKVREILKGVEQDRASWRRERELMDRELSNLRSEVAQLRAALTVSDVDRGSEEIDLKAVAEHGWLEGRQALAPITPEAVRARTVVPKHGSSGKENARSEEEVQRLRLENERLREKKSKLAKENKGLKSQYHYLLSNVRQSTPNRDDELQAALEAGLQKPSKIRRQSTPSRDDELQAALEAGLEKPSKIRRRSPVKVEPEDRSPGSSSNTNAPSTPALPQTVAEIVVTGPTPSTSGLKLKAEPEPELKEFPPTKGGTGLERKPDRATEVPTPMASNRKRPLESLAKPPAKPPAFKFVEPVRKKAERENLQATECKLCKKFYDAVARGDANGVVESRCTHVDKSRHRFRDLPPATPEGFWNIGFDSDF